MYVDGNIIVSAKKELILNCQGAYIKLSGGNIEIGAPNDILLRSHIVQVLPKDSLQIPIPKLPSNLEQLNFKRVTELYWTYGDDQVPVFGNSRHYSDLNLHAKTENYQLGEIIEIENGVIRSYQGKVGIDDIVVIRNIFENEIIKLHNEEE